MSKQILPNELAEIVTGLLLKPGEMGYLELAGQYEAFMQDIAQVVADHCGGEINQVNEAGAPGAFLSDADHCPMVSVSPNDSLGSLNENVWAPYDPEGWEDESAENYGIEVGEAPKSEDVARLRASIQGALSEAAKRLDTSMTMEDDSENATTQGPGATPA